MGKRTTKVRVFTIADYIEEQQWLEQQHRRGWRLVKVVPPCFFVFEACEPEESVYRIEYHNRRAAADYIQMYEDYGWEYVCSCMGWNYFCKSTCDISDARDKEIFSDAEDKLAIHCARKLRKLRKELEK